MKEAFFVKQHKAKWTEFEKNGATDPDQVAERFIQLNEDLSFSKTFFKDSEIIPYLNGLTGKFYALIYRNKKERSSKIIAFWANDLPLIMYKNRKRLLYSFLFFICFALIGVLSAAHDDQFVKTILGENYVNMTNENIKKGDPFGVYKSGDPTAMFLMIAFNNIYVTLRLFVMGIFFSVGGVYDLFTNGLMLGSFQYYFFSKGLGWPSVLVIWIHGVLEISSIIVIGGASLTLGNGLMFTGTLPRVESLRRGAIDGVKMVVGTLPVIVVAACLEGFVTRHDHMPLYMSLAILATSTTFIIGYFVIYPRIVFKTQTINSTNHGNTTTKQFRS